MSKMNLRFFFFFFWKFIDNFAGYCVDLLLFVYKSLVWMISQKMTSIYSCTCLILTIHIGFSLQERLILKQLKFRLNVATPYMFMLRFLKAAQSDTKVFSSF